MTTTTESRSTTSTWSVSAISPGARCPTAGRLAAATGQVIPVSRTAPAVDLTALFNGFKPLFQALTPADVNKFALEIIQTLQGEGGTVDSLLTQTASLTNTVADRDAVIGQVIDNLITVFWARSQPATPA